MTNFYRQSRGFSIVEMLTVFAVTFIIGGMCVLKVNDVVPQMKADSAASQVLGAFRETRERAVAERRNYQIRFSGNNQIELLRLNVPSGSTVVSTRKLENKAQFLLFAGLPDTPDAFGNRNAISFGSTPTLTFLSDGTFVDSTGAPLNGTAFFGLQNIPSSARAVTVMGATGKIQLYRWDGSRWVY